ncbi:unnamed protein product [Phytophthora fragariaefolia]|uniref:Unnamed protein product n=1 Tax=Phytophthora fragariaefolia TaxID=1490495 RepID=A0A9W7CRK7_9STRA|nr:unnamed protein product [Phytophthora fragariaefolia]
MCSSFVTLAAGVVLLTASFTFSVAGEATAVGALAEEVANPSFRNEGEWPKRLENDDDDDDLDGTDNENNVLGTDEIIPLEKHAEEEERAISKPSGSSESLWVKLFYKMFLHVKPPAPDIKHQPLRPLPVKDVGNGMVIAIP